jgi:hypothetical protein
MNMHEKSQSNGIAPASNVEGLVIDSRLGVDYRDS